MNREKDRPASLGRGASRAEKNDGLATTFETQNGTFNPEMLEAALQRGAALRLGSCAQVYTLAELRQCAAKELRGAHSLAEIVAGACSAHFASFSRQRTGFSSFFLLYFRDMIARCFGLSNLSIEIVAAALRATGFRIDTPTPRPSSAANIRARAFVPWQGQLRAVRWIELHNVLPPIEIVERRNYE